MIEDLDPDRFVEDNALRPRTKNAPVNYGSGRKVLGSVRPTYCRNSTVMLKPSRLLGCAIFAVIILTAETGSNIVSDIGFSDSTAEAQPPPPPPRRPPSGAGPGPRSHAYSRTHSRTRHRAAGRAVRRESQRRAVRRTAHRVAATHAYYTALPTGCRNVFLNDLLHHHCGGVYYRREILDDGNRVYVIVTP